MITKDEFDRLSPRDRGYAVYMAGSRDDQPNIPDESNPFAAGSTEAAEWDEGQREGVLEAMDSEE